MYPRISRRQESFFGEGRKGLAAGRLRPETGEIETREVTEW
jgi:hypothetical protein